MSCLNSYESSFCYFAGSGNSNGVVAFIGDQVIELCAAVCVCLCAPVE